jgi:hypothetical protein
MMKEATLYKLSGYCLIAGGLALSIFWLLVIPFDTFAGAEVITSPLYLISQVFHLIGAVVVLYGLIGLYLAYRERAGIIGLVGFVLTLLGAVGIVVDAVIGLVIAPALAVDAPATIEATGTLFVGPVLIMYIAIFATNMIGQLVFGGSLLRTDLPRFAVILFLVGAVASNLPPLPVLHLVLVAGGVLSGAASAWFGWLLVRAQGR